MTQEPPPKITDKREEKRRAAAVRREAEEAARAESMSVHPAGSDLQASEETVLTVDRLERIHQLREKAQQAAEIPTLVSLSSEERAELLRLQAEEDSAEDERRAAEGNNVVARTAFYVILMHDGTVRTEPDCNVMLELDHMANVDEMYAGVCVSKRDIEAAVAARHTVFQLQQQASAGMSRRLVSPPGGIVPPGRRR